MRKRIDLNEYIIKIFYDEKTGELDVEVFDAGEELIESISVTNDDEETDI